MFQQKVQKKTTTKSSIVFDIIGKMSKKNEYASEYTFDLRINKIRICISSKQNHLTVCIYIRKFKN